MLAIKGMQGLGPGLLPASGISHLVPTLFLSLVFPLSSAALLPGLVRPWAGPNPGEFHGVCRPRSCKGHLCMTE